MKKVLFLLLLFPFSLSAFAADTTRVLFIGNSFTAMYDVPSLVKGLADKAGFPMVHMVHAPGGISVGDISQGPMAHMNNPQVFDFIRNERWDYVVLQDNQGRFIYGGGIFPSTASSKVLEGHQKIRDSVVANNPCAHMLWFAGWAFKNGYPGIANTGEELIDNIYENYQHLNGLTPEVIAPIGPAWLRVKKPLPHIDLWGPDEAHQSLHGAYLTAAVIFSSIYRMNTEEVEYTGTIDSNEARMLRRIAYETVMDSLGKTGLSNITPGLQVSGDTLMAASGFSSYAWYLDTGLVSTGAANSISAKKIGYYHYVGTDSKGCKQRSLPKYVSQTTGIGSNAIRSLFVISPQPAGDYLSIDSKTQGSLPMQICLRDMTGRVLLTRSSGESHITLNTQELPAGAYVVQISQGRHSYNYRMVKGVRQ
jgi:hypothetical protein